MECYRKVYQNEGMKGFFKGGFTNAVRGSGSAIVLVLYDEIQKWLGFQGGVGAE